MTTLYLLRHAKAAPGGGTLADHERPLADRGRRHRQFVGGAREREVPGRSVKHAQAIEREMGPLHCEPDLVRRSRCRQRKERNRHIEQRAIGSLHRVMALHAAMMGAKRAARDIVMALPRLQDRLFADDAIATTVFLADALGKPLLVEGPAGTGKTELAKAVATAAGADVVRLQCYEGLDEARALYEWNYRKQLLRIQAAGDQAWEETHDDIFSDEFLLARPLLTAIRREEPTVLLVDETDKADVEVEGLLLEVLSDFQVTVPELGTIEAVRKPFVVLTSNATRELSEALKRRCLFLHVDYPDAEREKQILDL